MAHTVNTQPVVVGIDGSRAAVEAAMWAIDEAIDRDVSLRLIHATGMPRPPFAPTGALAPEIEYGETSLRAASSAVAATGKTVKVEAEILWGPVDDALIAESQSASMLCVGSVGIGWVARHGARDPPRSRCPERPTVQSSSSDTPSEAAIRQALRHGSSSVSTTAPSNEQASRHALEEAHLRHAPVLAVGTWSSELGDIVLRRTRQPRREMATSAIPTCTSTPWPPVAASQEFLAGYRDDVQLAVVTRCRRRPDPADHRPPRATAVSRTANAR